VAAISRSVVCQQRDDGMNQRPNNSPTPVAGHRRVPPVRVKVWGADGKLARVHPPACRSPLGGISELSMNASLAMIEAAKPKDEIEAALAAQMAATHTAAMAVLAKLDVAFATERRVAAFGSAAARWCCLRSGISSLISTLQNLSACTGSSARRRL
jgi:hypothetical protein